MGLGTVVHAAVRGELMVVKSRRLRLGVLALVLVAVAASAPLGVRRAGAGTAHPVPASGIFTVTGRGYGHGLGMSQHGAQGAALRGLDAGRILDHYYPGTSTARLAAGDRVRVRMVELSAGTLTVASSGRLTVRDLGTNVRYRIPPGPAYWRLAVGPDGISVQRSAGRRWVAAPLGGRMLFAGPLRFEGPASLRALLPYGSGSWVLDGTLTASRGSAGALLVVDTLATEQYVPAVVAREAFASWRPAALQAQAIAARTYAAYDRATASSRAGWDLCNTTACQVYRGRVQYDAAGRVVTLPDSVLAAGRATSGLIRTWRGAPIYAAYSASNGGWTVRSAAGLPYLPAAVDQYDGVDGSSAHRWTVSARAADLQRCDPDIGELRRVVITSRDGHGEWGGRVLGVRLEGSVGTAAVTGSWVRHCLRLRSNWFSLAAAPAS